MNNWLHPLFVKTFLLLTCDRKFFLWLFLMKTISGNLMFQTYTFKVFLYILNVYIRLGTVVKLQSISKHLNFKQCLISTPLSFKKDNFSKKLYFLIEIKQHFFKQYCLKISLNNVAKNCLETVKIYHNLATVPEHYIYIYLGCRLVWCWWSS